MKKTRFDYKRPETLEPYLDRFGRIKPVSETGLSSMEQRRLRKAVINARTLALLLKPQKVKREKK